MTAPDGLPSGSSVRSAKFGVGKVELDKGETVLVRFEHGFEECRKGEVEVVVSAEAAIARPEWDSALDVVLKCQAAAIRSVQDGWGVFSRSRIQLLPHQLWVCRRVIERWPARWVVADDVGLGKTIEAGLALMALLSSKRIQRVLVLCPASLVEQWLVRMRTMFDLRFAPYTTEADTPKSDFWGTHNQVVASLETLRLDQKDRWTRLVEAPPFDLLIVDEAHRLSDDEQGGPSLGYRLVDTLESRGRLASVLLFTGTPHRGKDYGFLSLLQLLHRDRFDPKKPLSEQLDQLSGVMIRNNKQAVTDLKGNRIFKKLHVQQRTYDYSDAERHFYGTLTDFITTGRAYASTLGKVQGQAVNLVLVAMQKLASSSVAAIRRALIGRLDRIAASRRDLQDLKEERASMTEMLRSERNFDFDAMNLLDEAIAEREFELRLMTDEEERLRELVELAKAVNPETKITEIVKLLSGELADRSVLFFTEYKATQALLISALQARFGEGCAVFINGDHALEGVEGRRGPWALPREEATERFNEGKVRFLVSTEAGGEGIDLQRACHTLVHVDLPWNPMRLHQRVGRLHRLGQAHDVQVYSFRNPATVEARIWDLLNAKINRIQTALSSVMDDPEDLFQLVLGMTSPEMFRDVFAGAASAPKKSEQLNSWFNARTATFGGRDVIDVVKSIVGHCQRFDFQGVSAQVPQVDLPDLRPFFVNALVANKRRPQDEAGGALSFKTPDAWRRPGVPIQSSYTAQRFERPGPGGRLEGVLGAGHPLIEAALAQALESPAAAATVTRADSLGAPLVVVRAIDRVTTTASSIRSVTLGVFVRETGPLLLRDWQLLQQLNGLTIGRAERLDRSSAPSDSSAVSAVVEGALRFATQHLQGLDVKFEVPELTVAAMLWPAEPARDAAHEQTLAPSMTPLSEPTAEGPVAKALIYFSDAEDLLLAKRLIGSAGSFEIRDGVIEARVAPSVARAASSAGLVVELPGRSARGNAWIQPLLPDRLDSHKTPTDYLRVFAQRSRYVDLSGDGLFVVLDQPRSNPRPDLDGCEPLASGLASRMDAMADDIYLVRLDSPVQPVWRRELRTFGEVLDHTSPETLRIALPSARIEGVRALPFVIAARRYELGDTVTTEFLRALEHGVDTRRALLDVTVHRTRDLARAETLVRSIPGARVIDCGEDTVRFEVELGSPALAALANLAIVRTLTPFEPARLFVERVRALLGLTPVEATTNAGVWTGAGEVVAIFDSGIDADHPDLKDALFAPPTKHGGGSELDHVGHGTHVAGIVAGRHATLGGVAREAKLISVGIVKDDGRTLDLPLDIGGLLNMAVQQGAKIINLSWGFSARNDYDVYGRGIDAFVRANPHVLIVVAAGNDGKAPQGKHEPRTMSMPAGAKNVVTVGACGSDRHDTRTWGQINLTRFPMPPASNETLRGLDLAAAISSRGPTGFDSVKPDLLAPGTLVISTWPVEASMETLTYASCPARYACLNGTSMAAPAVAGAAALVRQYLRVARDTPDPSASLLKAVLLCATRRMSTPSPHSQLVGVGYPDFDQGFGRLDLTQIPLAGAGRVLAFVDVPNDSAEALESHQPFEGPRRSARTYQVTVPAGSTGTLRVVLCWTDPPGRGVQNQLALVVKRVQGQVTVVGNREHTFLPDPSAGFDKRNNAQMVSVELPGGKTPYTYRLKVQATGDADPPQGYALVVCGPLLEAALTLIA